MVKRRTFKQLVDEVLLKVGNPNDTGRLRELVESEIRASHESRLTERGMSFLLMPPRTFSTAANRAEYSLHEYYARPLWFKNLTTGNPVELIPYTRLGEFSADDSNARGSATYASVHSVSPVLLQPVDTTIPYPNTYSLVFLIGVAGDVGQTVIIEGEDNAGNVVSETLTLATTAVSPSTYHYSRITAVTKIDNPADVWTGTSRLQDISGNTVLSLPVDAYGRQYPQITFLMPPAGVETIQYQFFRSPRQLVLDTDVPDTPYPFDRLHVLDTLISLQGFNRSTASEVRTWEIERQTLESNMWDQYADSNAENSEANYAPVINR